MSKQTVDFSARKPPHGFSAIINFSTAEFLGHSWADDFSTAIVAREDITVCVQAGVLSRESAESLIDSYLRAPAEFIPPRNTEGSFLLVDKGRKRIMAGRDRSQAYHLYYMWSGDCLYVSTHMISFCGTVSHSLDEVACDFYLNSGLLMVANSMLTGVHALSPGHYITCSGQSELKLRTFWKIERTAVPESYEEAVQHYGDLFVQNVARYVADDAVGVFLSGGSDSAAVMGALHKLGVKRVVAAHMAIKGNFPVEHEDCLALQQAYGFHLEMVTPETDSEDWLASIDEALLAQHPGGYATIPPYTMMGRKIGALLPPGGTVFNGEMCLLDQGFNVSGDPTRELRRWLYMGAGRGLSKLGPIWPFKTNWAKARRSHLDRTRWSDKWMVAQTMANAFLHALGRPDEYYAGAKLGYMSFPGMWFGTSFLPHDFAEDIGQRLLSAFFEPYKGALKGSAWKETFATMNTCWYSETTNFTMPLNSAAAGAQGIQFPFSSVEIMDFAASLPTEWCVDKKIQKDACVRVLDMPESVAYRMKDHRRTVPYFDLVYAKQQDAMKKVAEAADYGVLDVAVRELLASPKCKGDRLFRLYALAIYMKHYGVTIGS